MKDTILVDRINKFNKLIPFNKSRFLVASFFMIFNSVFALLMTYLAIISPIGNMHGLLIFGLIGYCTATYCFIKAGAILHGLD